MQQREQMEMEAKQEQERLVHLYFASPGVADFHAHDLGNPFQVFVNWEQNAVVAIGPRGLQEWTVEKFFKILRENFLH